MGGLFLDHHHPEDTKPMDTEIKGGGNKGPPDMTQVLYRHVQRCSEIWGGCLPRLESASQSPFEVRGGCIWPPHTSEPLCLATIGRQLYWPSRYGF